MTRRSLLLVVLTFALAATIAAQGSPEKKPSFEVASIKPNKDTGGGSWSTSGGRQTIIGTTATVLIMSAFNVHEYEVVGAPSWSDSERLDVITQTEGKSTREESRLMMQSLLERAICAEGASRNTRRARLPPGSCKKRRDARTAVVEIDQPVR
jgi:hypothetical protein